jgi:hypothetical protein
VYLVKHLTVSMAARWHRPVTAAPNRDQAGTVPSTITTSTVDHHHLIQEHVLILNTRLMKFLSFGV